MQLVSTNSLLLRLDDGLRYSPLVRTLSGLGHLLRAKALRSTNDKLFSLAEAHRRLSGVDRQSWSAPSLRPWVEDPERSRVWREAKIGWQRFPQSGQRPLIQNGLVLKSPGPNGERGVILISYEKILLDLMCCRDFAGLARDYSIILATSVSPPPFYILWRLAHYPGADVYFMISHWDDPARIGYLDCGAKVIEEYISNFINPKRYQPRPRDQRDIDILMVAIWGRAKRHWDFFRALSRIKRPLRVVLVGQPDSGWTMETIKAQAQGHGVLNRLEFQGDLPIEQVRRLQCRSKVSLIFSRMEGACVVNAESMFADTPVGLLRGAQLGTASFINQQTGVFLDKANLPGQIEAFVENHAAYSPRSWATEHIGHQATLARMNRLLREHALAQGRPWTRDLCLIEYAAGYPVYSREQDRAELAQTYLALKQRHGVVFTAFGEPEPEEH